MATTDPAGMDPNAESATQGGEDRAADRLDRRRGPRRRRVLRSASIVFDAGCCSMTCHVLDLSKTGAMVIRSDVLLCPDEFVLKPLVGPARECEVIWRKGAKIGVRYV